MKKIICLMGPTASGKTQLAIELLQHLPCEIISVDSAMVYRGMDIGTAKPSLQQQKITLHHLIDICDPKEIYSAGQFREDALRCINKILAAGKIPLLVGGTMLYFYVLQQGISNLPTANTEIREEIAQQAEKKGWQAMHVHLAEIDPESATRIHPNDSQRIARALEIFTTSGKTLTQIKEEPIEPLPYEIINVAIATNDREILHERIATRFRNMLQAGFVDEVEKLYRRGDLHRDLPAMRAVGYRQVWDYIDGKSSLAEMQEKAVIATRQLAKRQLTWLRGWQNIYWFDYDNQERANSLKSIITLIHKVVRAP